MATKKTTKRKSDTKIVGKPVVINNPRQKISKRNLTLAFTLATLVFIIGILVGNYTSERKYNSFESTLSDLRLQTLSLDLQYDLLSNDPCKIQNSSYLNTELSVLSSKLDYLEKLYGKGEPEILRLKKYYSILQIQHWLLYKKSQAQCEDSYDLVLYFYSNNPDLECADCKAQGTSLTAFRKKYPEKVKVYAFDKDIDDPAVRTLVDLYGVEGIPTVVYNDFRVDQLVSFNELEDLKRQYAEK